MLHAHVRTVGAAVGTGVEPLDQPFGLRHRRLEQREDVADRRVPILQLLEVLQARRASASDVGVVALDVLGSGRRAVGHHQHTDGSGSVTHGAVLLSVVAWTMSTSRCRIAGSVAGNTP